MKKITIIAGARPNFMKIAPIIHAIQRVKNESTDMPYSNYVSKHRTWGFGVGRRAK